MRNNKVFMVIILVCITISCFAQNDIIVGFSIDSNPLIKVDQKGKPDANLPMLFFALAGLKDINGVASGKICLGVDLSHIESTLVVPFIVENIQGQFVVKNGKYMELVKETPPEILLNQPVKYAVKYQLIVPFEMLEEKNLQWRYSLLYLYDKNGNVLGTFLYEKQ